MATWMTWIGPGLDGLAIVLLTAVLWRLGRDPVAVWGEREQRLQTIFDELRALVAQSEGLARDLDGKLAAREERLQTLVTAAQAAATRPALDTRPAADTRSVDDVVDEPAALAMRIATMADAGTAVEEIARRLGVAPAEVRLVVGLRAARAARGRVMTAEVRPDAS